MTTPWRSRVRRIGITVAVIVVFVLPVVFVERLTGVAMTIGKVLPALSVTLIVVLAVEALLVVLAGIWWLWWRLPRR